MAQDPTPRTGTVTTAEGRALSTHATRAAAFRRLADHQLDASYRLARAILRDDAAAEDATHDAFIRAWQHWDDLRDRERFEQWFTRILVNTCRDHVRRTVRVTVRDISDQIRSPHDEIRDADDREALRAAMDRLSPDHRAVVALRFYRDLPIGEIAMLLNLRVGTVHSRLHYALKHLAAALGRGVDGDDR